MGVLNKARFKIMSIIFLGVLIAFFCINEEKIKLTEKNKPQNLIKNIIEEDININYVDILRIFNLDGDKIVMVKCEIEENQYEGFFHLSRENEIVKKVLYKENKEEAFSFNCFSGQSEEKRENFLFIGGMVHNSNIKSIGINFEDNTFINLIVGSDNSYSYITNRKPTDIKNLVGFNEKYEIYK